MSRILSTWGEGVYPNIILGIHTHPRVDTPLGKRPPEYYRIRSTSGWYVSYWNAFLFGIIFVKNRLKMKKNWTKTGTRSSCPLRSATVIACIQHFWGNIQVMGSAISQPENSFRSVRSGSRNLTNGREGWKKPICCWTVWDQHRLFLFKFVNLSGGSNWAPRNRISISISKILPHFLYLYIFSLKIKVQMW